MKVIVFVGLALTILSLDIPSCKQPIVPTVKQFTYTTTGQVDSTTQAYLCHDGNFLYINWWSQDEEIISTYTQCNDPLYNEDAVEIFLATQASYPNIYFELQVSPKGQLFFADITNPNLTCGQLSTFYYACSSVSDYGGRKIEGGWQAWIQINLSTVGRGSKPKTLKGNLFRIDKSTSKPTRYLSMVPTFSNPACFHKPLTFVEMNLV